MKLGFELYLLEDCIWYSESTVFSFCQITSIGILPTYYFLRALGAIIKYALPQKKKKKKFYHFKELSTVVWC